MDFLRISKIREINKRELNMVFLVKIFKRRQEMKMDKRLTYWLASIIGE